MDILTIVYLLDKIVPITNFLFIKYYIFLLIFVGVKLIYNFVLVSAVHQSGSVIHISTLSFQIPFPIGHHRALGRVPCAIQQAISDLFHV